MFIFSGLFAGFSLLTILELIFYFIVRPSVEYLKSKTKVHPIRVRQVQQNSSPRCAEKSLTYFYHYMEECSLHGLNHATFKNLQLIERIFWLIAFVVSMIFCGFLLNTMYSKYVNAPITISYDGDINNIKNVRYI